MTHATTILGLCEVERQNETVYLICDEQHHALQLIASDTAAFDHIALEATSVAALEELQAKLQREEMSLLSEHPWSRGLHTPIRFLGPSGHLKAARPKH